MKKAIFLMFVFAITLFGLKVYAEDSQAIQNAPVVQTKTVDINKDGKPDVTYYHDEKYVTKVEADTNYDGKPDVAVYTENGKFKSAEADTDYNGSTDKKFDDAAAFNKWLSENKPDFQDSLNPPDWTFPLLKF
ncbi:MAG: hypothetical protein Q8N14_00155 [Candidatus Omnitrophota bacterium]|nr:hypothetical protein [Candidatus Omnitrophota bacterium]